MQQGEDGCMHAVNNSCGRQTALHRATRAGGKLNGQTCEALQDRARLLWINGEAIILETAVDRFLALDMPYELQLLYAPARSPQW